MDSFPEEFSFSFASAKRRETILKAQLREAREYAVSQYKKAVDDKYFLLNLEKYDLETRTALLDEIVQRFPYIGYEIPNPFSRLVDHGVFFSGTPGMIKYTKGDQIGNATSFLVCLTEHMGKNLSNFAFTRQKK